MSSESGTTLRLLFLLAFCWLKLLLVLLLIGDRSVVHDTFDFSFEFDLVSRTNFFAFCRFFSLLAIGGQLFGDVIVFGICTTLSSDFTKELRDCL